MIVMFIGPAGCGKTSLTATFGSWLKREMGAKVAYVNLDPGCLFVPYDVSFDVRDWFTVEGLMKKEGLGPNGAMIRASDLMASRAEEIADIASKLDAEFKLIDTPGQMEVFVFRPVGPRITEVLKSSDVTVAIYIADPEVAMTPTGLAVATSLYIATYLRLAVPTIPVLNKSDKVASEIADKLLTDFDYFRSRIIEEESGAITDLALRFVDAIRDLSQATRLVKVSAKAGLGMEELYDLIREALCVCGDLT